MRAIAIFVLLLTVLFFWRTNSQTCVCPSQARAQTAGVSIIAHSAGLCNDCGHTKTCCSEKQSVKMLVAGGATVDAPLDVYELALSSDVNSESHPKELFRSRFTNRAPPWSIQQTPYYLHQKLLV